jgi:hypothetical protein
MVETMLLLEGMKERLKKIYLVVVVVAVKKYTV